MSKVWRNQGRAGSAVEAWAGGVSDRARIDGGLVLPGTTGNYASSPDSAALSITGDIDIKVKCAATDWTPSEVKTAGGKWSITSNQRSYILAINTDGKLRLYWSNDGTALNSTLSTEATNITDGATKWIRATMDVNDGAGNRVTKFYTSDNGTTWTQLGTTVTTAGTTSIFDSTALVEIGSSSAGTSSVFAGTIHRVIIQSAYDTANNTTSLVYDANFETQPDYTLSFTEGSSNAATVTINQSSTSNDPLLLTAGSQGVVYLPGAIGNSLSVPDSAALSITGDIDIKVRCTAIDWTPSGLQCPVAKWNGATPSYYLRIETTGGLSVVWTDNGGTTRSLASTAVLGLPDSTTKWIRATLDVDNGASQASAKFYLSDDGSVWTQLGTTVTGTFGTTSIRDGSSTLTVGVRDGDMPFAGSIHRVIIQSAYDTADNTSNLACDINCDAITSHAQTTFTEQSSNAATVTINRSTTGRKLVAMPSTSKGGKNVWLFGTDDYLETPDNANLDIGASESATMMVVHRHWNNFGTNDTLIAKKADTTNTTQGWFVGSGGVATGTTGNGIVAASGSVPAGLKLTAASGQNATTPDSAALSITGDIDIKAKITLTDWTPTGSQIICTKNASIPVEAAFQFRITTSGMIRLDWSADGTTLLGAEPTVTPGFSDGATKWVRVTMDVDNGSSQRVAKFYTSDNGTSWTQLGNTVTTSGTTSIYDTTRPLQIGGRSESFPDYLFNGTIHRVIIQSAYDTANNTSNLVFDANFETQEADTITFKETSSNAATVTVNGCYPFANAVQAQIGDGTDGMTRFTDARTAGQLSTTAFVLNRANNTITPYLNGVARNTRNITDVGDLSNSNVFRIGRLSGAGTEYLDAEVYAVGLWKRALTAAEITALHNLYVGRIP